jgi:hypothetical protein
MFYFQTQILIISSNSPLVIPIKPKYFRMLTIFLFYIIQKKITLQKYIFLEEQIAVHNLKATNCYFVRGHAVA